MSHRSLPRLAAGLLGLGLCLATLGAGPALIADGTFDACKTSGHLRRDEKHRAGAPQRCEQRCLQGAAFCERDLGNESGEPDACDHGAEREPGQAAAACFQHDRAHEDGGRQGAGHVSVD